MSRALFLLFFVMVAFLAVAAEFHYGGVRPGELGVIVRDELHEDLVSLREDGAVILANTDAMRTALQNFWFAERVDTRMLQADARLETRRLVRPLARTQQE